MNYTLNTKKDSPQIGVMASIKKIWALMSSEKKHIFFAGIAIFVNSGLSLLGPFLVGLTIDRYVIPRQYHGVLVFSGILLLVYTCAFIANYIQMSVMGGVAQRVLFRLRNSVFGKLQELPVAFFNQNKAGDLISRINNDTDKLNQFFSGTLMRFMGSIFIIIGAGIFIVVINTWLGLASLIPAVFLFIFTKLVSPWVKRRNAKSLQSTGAMSSEIQESLSNFKVIVAFNRRDYFEKKFAEANAYNYKVAVGSGLANNILTPLYDLSSSIAQLIVLCYGIYLISQGYFTIGLLISFLTYVNRFYDPLRQMAQLWSSFQVALASWDRISEILNMQTDMKVLDKRAIHADTHGVQHDTHALIEFKNVSFSYPEGKNVLKSISFVLQKGKTYALVGPTGGGKTTTASLMARLYDPTEGHVFLDNHDIRSYTHAERTKKIGFILQEPIIFTGTVKENILYGNEEYAHFTPQQLEEVIKGHNLEELMGRFDQGLETKVLMSGDSLSLGQRQIIAFMRAVLRNPELLILDEATANIDTVTEGLLEDILKKLPPTTTKVIIAHRLNTIENADEIFFVNGGTITQAGSMEHAVDMLLHHKRQS